MYYMYIYIYIYICVYIYIYIYSRIRPHPFYALFAVSRITVIVCCVIRHF